MILKNVQYYDNDTLACKDIEIPVFEDKVYDYKDLLCIKSFSAVIENNFNNEDPENYFSLKKQFIDECIKNGITRIVDVSSDFLLSAKICLDYNIDAYIAVKLFPDEDISENIIDYKINKINDINKSVKVVLAFDSVFDFNEDQITEIVKYSKKHNMYIYTKISRSLEEVGECDKLYNMSPVEFLESMGILDRKCIIAGCEYLEKDEMLILKNYDSTICLNVSNAFIEGVGFAPIYSMLNHNINICVGLTDSARPNIFREMFLLAHTQSAVLNIPHLLKIKSIIDIVQNNIINDELKDENDLIIIENDYKTQNDIGTKIVNDTNVENILFVIKNNKICYKK